MYIGTQDGECWDVERGLGLWDVERGCRDVERYRDIANGPMRT